MKKLRILTLVSLLSVLSLVSITAPNNLSRLTQDEINNMKATIGVIHNPIFFAAIEEQAYPSSNSDWALVTISCLDMVREKKV